MTIKYREIKEKPAPRDSFSKNKEQTGYFLEDSLSLKNYSFQKEEYHQIDKTLLYHGKEIFFDIYMREQLKIDLVIKAAPKSPVKIDSNLLPSAAGDIVIKKSDILLYQDYLASLAEISEPSKESKAKAIIIRENSKILIKELFDDPRSGEKIKELKTLVNNMIDCILENRDAIYSMLSLKNYDHYTYTHSVNVAALSIGLGIAIDIKRDDIEKLGTGAMLHDIGKSLIHHEILNKRGKLDLIEYLTMQSHVVEGEKILRTHKDIPPESFDAVLQHHEKLTGRGYPFKLSGNDVKMFGRITAIADCYDALTTRRPYRSALTSFHALAIVTKETGDYDPDILSVFIKTFGKIKQL